MRWRQTLCRYSTPARRCGTARWSPAGAACSTSPRWGKASARRRRAPMQPSTRSISRVASAAAILVGGKSPAKRAEGLAGSGTGADIAPAPLSPNRSGVMVAHCLDQFGRQVAMTAVADVAQCQHTDHPLVVVDDRKPPDLARFHDTERIL